METSSNNSVFNCDKQCDKKGKCATCSKYLNTSEQGLSDFGKATLERTLQRHQKAFDDLARS